MYQDVGIEKNTSESAHNPDASPEQVKCSPWIHPKLVTESRHVTQTSLGVEKYEEVSGLCFTKCSYIYVRTVSHAFTCIHMPTCQDCIRSNRLDLLNLVNTQFI